MNTDCYFSTMQHLCIDDLYHICISSKEFYIIGTNKYFWITYFNNHHFPTPTISFTDNPLNNWILYYIANIKTKRYLNNMTTDCSGLISKKLDINQLNINILIKQLSVNNKALNTMLIEFINDIKNCDEKLFSLYLGLYKDNYLLQLESRSISDVIDYKNHKYISHIVSKDIIFEYYLALIYYKLYEPRIRIIPSWQND